MDLRWSRPTPSHRTHAAGPLTSSILHSSCAQPVFGSTSKVAGGGGGYVYYRAEPKEYLAGTIRSASGMSATWKGRVVPLHYSFIRALSLLRTEGLLGSTRKERKSLFYCTVRLIVPPRSTRNKARLCFVRLPLDANPQTRNASVSARLASPS